MLFQRLYNWIKYKTLPTSFLFKNRLFIERDSKTKRIFSNLGLTFRNSKWSDYSMYNIKPQFQNNFLKLFLYFLLFSFLLIIFIYSKKYYMLHYSFNLVAFNLWFSFDSFDYYISFIMWLTAMFFSTVLTSLHSYLFFNNFSSNKRLSFIPSNLKKKVKERSKFTSRWSLNHLLYNWLNAKENNIKPEIIANLFETQLNAKWWDNNYLIFHNIYKIQNKLTKLLLSFNSASSFFKESLELKSNNFEKNKILSLFNNSKINPSQLSLIIWYTINLNNTKTSITPCSEKTPISFDNTFGRNLTHFDSEIVKHASLIFFKTGQFYMTEINGFKLNNYLVNFKELQFFTENIQSQFSIAKWNRWLYRYSILHRKILKNSHKLTVIKRLLNSGLYNFINKESSLWSIQKVGKLKIQNDLLHFNVPFIKHNNNVLPFLNHTIFSSNISNKFYKINNLSNYENSFFFFIKRFFFFNTLPTNNTFNQKKLNTSSPSSNFFHNDRLRTHFILTNYLLKNHAHWLIQYDLYANDYANDNVHTTYTTSNTETIAVSKIFKDYFIFNNDSDLLSPSNLNVLFTITNTLKASFNFNFYNYKIYPSILNKDWGVKFYDNENFDLEIIDPIYSFSQIEEYITKQFLQDFIYFNKITTTVYFK